MADKKISALTAATTPLAGTEVLPIVQSGATVKVAVSDLTAGRAISATGVSNGLGAVATPSYTFTGDTNTGMWSPGADAVAISTAGNEVLRATSTGRVGIGINSPGFTLHVKKSTAGDPVASFENTSAGASLSGTAVFIEAGGNNTNSYHLVGVTQTVGAWYLYGNGTTSYTSDIRVKKNVATTRDGYLEDVCKLRVVKYNWYNDSDDTPRELGFIAQEVEQVFPGLVQDAMHPTKDGEIHKVLKGSVLMPIMLKALQEANAKIDALTARVTLIERNS